MSSTVITVDFFEMLLSSSVGVSWKYKSAEILMTKRSLDVYNISLKCSNHRKRTWEEESLQTFWKVNLWVHQKPSFLKRKEKFFHRLYVENQIHILRYSKKSHLVFKNKNGVNSWYYEVKAQLYQFWRYQQCNEE